MPHTKSAMSPNKPNKDTPNDRSAAREGESGNLRTPAVLFDLDGTLVDSVYAHIAAWTEALRSENIYLPHWKIHRRIGMSGGLLLRVLLREVNHKSTEAQIDQLEQKHAANFRKGMRYIQTLPGARDLLKHLTQSGVKWAIATSGNPKEVHPLLADLKIPPAAPVVTGDDVDRAKPAPDIFVVAAERLGTSVSESIVVGDSTWDILAAVRKKGLGVGLLSGGYGRDELESAGAYRVYQNPADLLLHIEDLGFESQT